MPELSEQRRSARAVLASTKAQLRRRPDDAVVLARHRDAERDYWALELADHVTAVVDKAPPLTQSQVARLIVLLAPVGAH